MPDISGIRTANLSVSYDTSYNQVLHQPALKQPDGAGAIFKVKF